MDHVKRKSLALLKSLYYPVAAIFCALLVGGIILTLLGFDALNAYKCLLLGALSGKNALAETVLKSVPLIFTALSFAVARKCGLINLGAEGQFYMGALAATVASTMISLPPAIHIPVVILMGFAGGAAYGALVGLLKMKFGASELITTIMFNYIAIYLVAWCVTGPLQDPNQTGFPQSAKALATARLPQILSGTRLHLGIVIAIAAVVFYYIFMTRTTRGYELRVVGQNPHAARYAGIGISSNSILAMALAGGFAGLGGCVELIGVQYILRQNFSNNYGFDGIAVALLGGCNPVGMTVSAFLFGMLRSGSNKMQMIANVPSPAIYMIQGLVILFIIGRGLFTLPKKRAKKEAVKNG